MNNVIILNKPFSGSWLDTEGNIGHEIIDFVLTDNGEHYLFNNPAGVCGQDVWVGENDENSFGLKRTKEEKHTAKYMVLTSAAHGKPKEPKKFKILYVIALKEKLHRGKCPTNPEKDKTKDATTRKSQDYVIEQIIKKRDIRYNGVLLHDIYQGIDDVQSDDSYGGGMFLTFWAGDTYKSKDHPAGVPFEPESYNFQRNRGYLYEDKYKGKFKADYDKLMKIINDIVQNGEKVDLVNLTTWAKENTHGSNVAKSKTFLDLIGAQYNEQSFTYLLAELLKNDGDDEIFKEFCKEFKGKDCEFAEDEEFRIAAEKKVPKGRVDVCGESKSHRVVIENKIHSGLNGKKADGTSQLSAYRNWAKEQGKKALCFIAVPDFRVEEIRAEMKNEEGNVKNEEDKFKVIKYSEIAGFIKKYKDNFKAELIKPLIDQIYIAFKKLGEEKQESFYAELFYQATEEAKKRSKNL